MSEQPEDLILLSAAASWRLHRLKAELAWAESDLRTLFHARGDDPDFKIPADHVGDMQRCLAILSDCKPKTIGGAIETLFVAVEILALREVDDDRTIAAGAILPMVRNVWCGLKAIEARCASEAA